MLSKLFTRLFVSKSKRTQSPVSLECVIEDAITQQDVTRVLRLVDMVASLPGARRARLVEQIERGFGIKALIEAGWYTRYGKARENRAVCVGGAR